MMRWLFALSLNLGFVSLAPAAVVVLGNFTPDEITCTITEFEKKPQTIVLAKAQVLPIAVSGPCEVTFPAKPANASLRLDPYHAYVFIPDKNAERKLEGIFMPGDPPPEDARPEKNPLPRTPAKIPVTLMVDDVDPRADALWQKTLRKRFDEAAEIVEAHSGFKLEFAGFDMWNSDPDTKDITELLVDFSTKVKVKPGALAIGYTSRVKVDPKEPQHLVPFGAAKPFPTNHILLRESGPRADPEKVEALIHHLGLALGATLIDPEMDGGSVMRSKIADGLALHPQYRYRFDPLNVLAMSIWAEEMRRAPLGKPADISEAGKIRLARVYKALVKERPGDANALAYINELDREIAMAPVPKAKDADPAKVDPPQPMALARAQVARQVIRAIVARAKANTGPAAITGDALTVEYVKAGALAAWREDGPPGDQEDRMSGLLVGLAVALDDSNALLSEPSTAEAAKAVETELERIERLKVLGNPTLRGRRDLCRRFAVGCATGELLRTTSQAEQVAIGRSFSKEAFVRPNGASFTALAAEFAGIELARLSMNDLIHVRRLTGDTSFANHLPILDDLREGLSPERFKDDFGDSADPRFQKVLSDIRSRVRKGK